MQLTDRIYSGGEPAGDEAFAALVKLGVHTIASVDGARPDVEAARRHGLRYVHIPIGYDGVSREAGLQLAKLARDAEGPIYIHCHHGTHRGPAAAAVACIAAGAANADEAVGILEAAGTSRDYPGLWRDVAAYEPPAKDAELPELPEVAEVDSLAAAMANVDRAVDLLALSSEHDWQTPPKHPDVSPAQKALLLREAFHEIGRSLANENPYDDRFAEWIAAAEANAARLESSIRAETPDASDLLAAMRSRCKQCHAAYRN